MLQIQFKKAKNKTQNAVRRLLKSIANREMANYQLSRLIKCVMTQLFHASICLEYMRCVIIYFFKRYAQIFDARAYRSQGRILLENLGMVASHATMKKSHIFSLPDSHHTLWTQLWGRRYVVNLRKILFHFFHS